MWQRMREALWPEGSADEHAAEIARYFAGRLHMPLEVLLAFDEAGATVGFAELSIRAYAEGCLTDRVAYLEGWYVVPAARGRGVGAALVAAAESWALAQGCTEFASDALADNETSLAAHRALGFDEVEQIRCFRKRLSAGRSTAAAAGTPRDAKADVAAALARLSAAWRNRRYDELAMCFDEHVVMALPGFAGRVEGRDALVASYREFMERSTLDHYAEEPPSIDVWGDTAVTSQRWQMRWTDAGTAQEASGHEAFVLRRLPGRTGDRAWLVVWRTMSIDGG